MGAHDDLRLVGLLNSYDVAEWARLTGRPAVYLTWLPTTVMRPASWQVVEVLERGPEETLDQTKLTRFDAWEHGGPAPALDAAMAWGTREYAVPDWAKLPGLGRDLFPLGVKYQVVSAIREHKKNLADMWAHVYVHDVADNSRALNQCRGCKMGRLAPVHH